MMILGHLGTEPQAWEEPDYVSGLLYPDVFIVSPHVMYATTHYLAVSSVRALRKTAHLRGRRTKLFVEGMVRHLRDDRHLPFLAQRSSRWGAAIAHRVCKCMQLGALADQSSQAEWIILQEVAEGVLEFALAARLSSNPLHGTSFQSTLESCEVIQLIAEQWQLDFEIVKRMNARWVDLLTKLAEHSVSDLVWLELRALWPKLVASHLRRSGLLTARESVLAHKQIEAEIDDVLRLMETTSQAIRDWLPVVSVLQAPQAASLDLRAWSQSRIPSC